MKKMMFFRLLLAVVTLSVIANPDVIAETSNGVLGAKEKALVTAIENLEKAKKALQSAIERNPQGHGSEKNPWVKKIEEAAEEVKTAAETLKKARGKNQVDEDKKVKNLEEKKRKNEEDKKKVEDAKKERDRNNPIRDALKKLAEKGRAVAEAKDDADAYDKAKKEYDDAKKEVDKARADKANKEKSDEEQKKSDEEQKKIDDLADKLKKAKDAYKTNPTEENLNAQEEAQDALDEATGKSENNDQSALPKNNNQRSVGYISTGGTYTFGHPDSWFVPHQAFDGIMSSPEIYPQLSEVVGGEFTPGDLSSQRFTGVEMSGRYHITPAIGAGIGIGRNLELGVQVSKFHAEWEGRMLYTVFPWGSNVPRTAISKVNASATGMQSDLDAKYFLTGGKLRPYLHTGIRGQWLLKSSTHMDIDGMRISLDAPTINMTTVSTYAGAGVRMFVNPNAFVQAGTAIAKMPGSGYTPTANISVGWNFGGVSRRDIPIPPPIDILAGINATKKISEEVDCAVQKEVYKNESTDEQEITFTVTDLCPGLNSFLYILDEKGLTHEILVIEDGKQVNRTITLKSGYSLFVLCFGDTEGNCPVEIIVH